MKINFKRRRDEGEAFWLIGICTEMDSAYFIGPSIGR